MSTFEFILALLGSDVAVGLATFLLMRRANLRKHSAETDAKVIDNDKNGFETYRQQIAYLNEEIFRLTRQLTELRVTVSAFEVENKRLLLENDTLRTAVAQLTKEGHA